MKTTIIYISILLSCFFLFMNTKEKRKSSKETSNNKPNVVFLLVDDLGWKDLSVYGSSFYETPNIILILTDDAGYADFSFQSDRSIPTPNIDALQQHGVTFNQAYVTAPNCSPSRAGLLTGKYQQRFGHEYNLYNAKPLPGTSKDSLGLPLSQKLMPQYLKELGYETAIIGKWHLGLKDYYHPTQRGFDYFFGFRGGTSYYTSGQATTIEQGCAPINANNLPYLTDAFGNKAVKFIHRQKNKPFFLFLSFNAPHVPLQAKEEYLDFYRTKFKSLERATNAAMMRSIDDNVGKILAALEENDILNNTLIVFTNDNGGPLISNGDNGSSNFPLRGAKVMLYEGGIRVPMIIHWPAHITGSNISEEMVSTLDLLPTFIAAAGGNISKEDKLDGFNLLPLLKKGKKLRKRNLYWRQGNIGAVINGKWKLIYFNGKREYELYNLKDDINESINLATRKPVRAKKLLKQYFAWQKTLAEPLWIGGPSDKKVLNMYK